MKRTTHSPINHLGSRLERQQSLKLPLHTKIAELKKYTLLVQETLESVLPTEIVQTLQVICFDNTSLTLSTDSYTAANHLNYTRQGIIEVLRQSHPIFSNLQEFKCRVVMVNHRFSKTAPSNFLQRNQNVKTVTSCEFSDLTKQNITQLATLVTSNKRLVQVLQKLTKDPNR